MATAKKNLTGDRVQGRPDPTGRLLSVEQVAQLLGFSEKSIYRWIRAGRLPCVRFGRSIRVAEADVTHFTDENRVIHENEHLSSLEARRRARQERQRRR